MSGPTIPDAGDASDDEVSAQGPRDGDDATDALTEDQVDDLDPDEARALVKTMLANGAVGRQPPKRTGIFVDVDSLRVHVGDLLRATLGGYQVDAFGNFTFEHEGARVFVTVSLSPAGPQVGVFSVTNVEADLTLELSRFLLTTNQKLAFGAFSYDEENRSVWLRHALLGTTLDAPELQSAVAAVAMTAAHFDDVIEAEFGARRFADQPDHVQKAAHPPEPDERAGGGTTGYL